MAACHCQTAMPVASSRTTAAMLAHCTCRFRVSASCCVCASRPCRVSASSPRGWSERGVTAAPSGAAVGSRTTRRRLHSLVANLLATARAGGGFLPAGYRSPTTRARASPASESRFRDHHHELAAGKRIWSSSLRDTARKEIASTGYSAAGSDAPALCLVAKPHNARRPRSAARYSVNPRARTGPVRSDQVLAARFPWASQKEIETGAQGCGRVAGLVGIG